MLESQGRLVIGRELIEKADLKGKQKVDIFFDTTKKAIVILDCDDVRDKSMLYYVATHKFDEKGRLFIPIQLRNAFPGATYLPTEKDGMVYILIFEH